MSDRYLIISADAHAGLPAEGYRPYLDTKYHPQFDEYLAERHANRDELLNMNYDYIMGWETDNEEGLRGAWDIDQRDKELDADGVTAEVMFADADAITGMASPPFGAGLSAGSIADPELAFAGARAPIFAARNRRCSKASRASAGCRGSGRHFRPRSGSLAGRPCATMSRPSIGCVTSSSKAPSGSPEKGATAARGAARSQCPGA